MPFDIQILADFAEFQIRNFSKNHPEEVFYAFAVDDGLLCLNSEAKFEETLKYYAAKWPKRCSKDEDIADLKANTGDWEWQGFADFADAEGWDHEAASDHYDQGLDNPGEEAMASTSLAIAVAAVLEELKRRNAFACLRRTDDFNVVHVSHNY